MLAKHHRPPAQKEGIAEAMRLTRQRTHSPRCAVKSNLHLSEKSGPRSKVLGGFRQAN